MVTDPGSGLQREDLLLVIGYVEGDGCRLAYRVLGAGERTITLLHSLALSGDWFLPLASQLPQGYRIVVPDFRGHGESATQDQHVSLAGLVDDLCRVWDSAAVHQSEIVGISMGGMVAQAVGGRHPDRVRSAALIATTGFYDEPGRIALLARAAHVRESNDMSVVCDELVDRWFAGEEGDCAVLRDRARRQLLNADPQIHASFLEAMAEVGSFGFAQAGLPTLVLGGTGDASRSRVQMTAFAAAIPTSELYFVAGGHLVAFTNPTEVSQHLERFLSRSVPHTT